MRLTTLCYIEKDGKYLMLHRTKKRMMRIMISGSASVESLSRGESPDECLIREVKEETGLTLTKYQFRGIVTFCSDEWEDEYMHLFTATEFERRSQSDCVHEQVAKAVGMSALRRIDRMQEGTLEWVDKEKVLSLPTWEGDHLFLERLLSDDPQFFFTESCV